VRIANNWYQIHSILGFKFASAMTLDVKLILDVVGKLFYDFDARWERRLHESASIPTSAVVIGATVIADNWGSGFDGGEDPFEPYRAMPSIFADNWGGLFDGDGDNTVANAEHLDSDANKLRQYMLLDVVPVEALAISNSSCSRSMTTFLGSPMTFPTSAPPHDGVPILSVFTAVVNPEHNVTSDTVVSSGNTPMSSSASVIVATSKLVSPSSTTPMPSQEAALTLTVAVHEPLVMSHARCSTLGHNRGGNTMISADMVSALNTVFSTSSLPQDADFANPIATAGHPLPTHTNFLVPGCASDMHIPAPAITPTSTTYTSGPVSTNINWVPYVGLTQLCFGINTEFAYVLFQPWLPPVTVDICLAELFLYRSLASLTVRPSPNRLLNVKNHEIQLAVQPKITRQMFQIRIKKES
jgi:hypothetical protein